MVAAAWQASSVVVRHRGQLVASPFAPWSGHDADTLLAMSEQGFEGPFGVGDHIGQHRIDAVAGRGGMGLVYRAWDDRLQRTIAIKVIAPNVASDPTFRARFEQESLLAAQIEHPNVIPVYEVGEHQGSLFIVMRFVDGVDLRELLRRSGRLEPRAAAAIVVQIAAALDAAHSRGLVHRDVKPGNVMVTGKAGSEHVYLTDFGITKRIAQTGGLTATGALVGTLDYIAPEQLLGHPVDARSDVYALGCLLYELLTGSVPFSRDTDTARILAHVNDVPTPASTLAPALPPELDSVLAKAMAKDPDERYPSAGDLGHAAVAGAEGRTYAEPTRSVAVGPAAAADALTTAAAPSESVAPSERRTEHRVRWGLTGAVAIVAVAGAVLAIALSGGSGTATANSPATVARAWVAAYNAGDFATGASYFRSGAKVNGSTFTSRAQFVHFQAAYKCAVKVRSLSVKASVVTIRAVNGPGPGATQTCKGYIGTTDVIVLRIQRGKIAEFSLT
jgi:hypothetical protein